MNWPCLIDWLDSGTNMGQSTSFRCISVSCITLIRVLPWLPIPPPLLFRLRVKARPAHVRNVSCGCYLPEGVREEGYCLRELGQRMEGGGGGRSGTGIEN